VNYLSRKNGQAFLALTFFIGGILAVAGILIAALALSYIDTGYGVAASFRAEAAATAGAEDGVLQLDRNAQFQSAGYTVSAASSTTATVTVTQSSPAAGQATILSVATVSGHTKKVNVVVSISAVGQVSVVSWADIQ
jgi:hypothetical protein